VVRIDLNVHADALTALNVKHIDNMRLNSYRRLLKLKPGFDLELFEHCP